jgi:hypothetical protein
MPDREKPPYDQPVIPAASVANPATACGVWVLAATILGSSMAFIVPVLTAENDPGMGDAPLERTG